MKGKLKLLIALLFCSLILHGQTIINPYFIGSTNTYIHNQPQSFSSKIIKLGMGLLGIKKSIKKNIENGTFQKNPAPFPKSLIKNFEITETSFGNRTFWTIKPKQHPSNKIVFYIHGGAYISNVIAHQWHLVEALISKTNATFIIPNYEIAPFSTYKETFEFINSLYNQLLTAHKSNDFILMGDSAGGGFALGFVMTLRNNNQIQPSQIILLSPWLDITMQNPEIKKIDKYDKMLAIEGLQMAGDLFAGDMKQTDYRLSPIYGNFKGLNKISVFIGTHDLFIADTRKMKNILDSNSIPFNYFEYPKMFHVWVAATKMKEAKISINQISKLINNSDIN